MPDCVALTAADLECLLAANPDDNAEAAFWIGYCHLCGTGGVEEDDDTAALYFEKAAKHNHAKALWRLAYCYQYGCGVSMDRTRATQLFQKASAALQSELPEDPNDAEAQFLLGRSYDGGYGGLNKDKARAFWLYHQAAQQGHVNGQYEVGYRLEYGDGVTKDCVQAAGWHGQAARQGHSYARTYFDRLFARNAELKEQLAAVAQNGARDQQKTFLAASALAYYWTRKNGANSTTAQQWQAIADQCTNKLPPPWKPRILVERHPLSKSPAEEERRRREEEERRRTEEVARLRQKAERLRQKAAEAEQEVARLPQEAERLRRESERRRQEEEEERRRREETAERLRREAEEEERREAEERRRREDEEDRNRREARYGQREESQAPPIRSGAFDRRATSPLRKLQNIQNNNDVPVRQAQLAALVQELQVYCNRRSANKPEVFRVLGYCCDHGIGMEQEDKEQAFRLYVKADQLVGIKPGAAKKNQSWCCCRSEVVSSAQWLYDQLEDERVTCYETYFALDLAMQRLRTAVTRGETARDSATVELAIRCEFELAFLQGLLRMDRFTSETELREKADKLTKQVDRAKNKAKRLPLIRKLEKVTAQLKEEVEAREEAERQRRHQAANASHPPPSAPLEEELQAEPKPPPRSFQ